ncbi:hypothetical protein K523DRAFT_255816 [Schizophyllum commune Tattone D]|nr:hypothetical protein K523DRAFT_255816 [Schizophyllum commune Tattone D]
MSGVVVYLPPAFIVDQDCLQDYVTESGVYQGLAHPSNTIPLRLDGPDRCHPIGNADFRGSSTRVNIQASDAMMAPIADALPESGIMSPLLYNEWYGQTFDTMLSGHLQLADVEHNAQSYPTHDTVQEANIIDLTPVPVHPPAPSVVSLSPLAVTQSVGQNSDVMNIHYSGDSLHPAQRLEVATPSRTRAAMSRRAPKVKILHHCPYPNCGATLTRLASLKGTNILCVPHFRPSSDYRRNRPYTCP